MKKATILVASIVAVFSSMSCQGVRNTHCLHYITVPVTYITKTGNIYTVMVPLCDSLKTDAAQPEQKTTKKVVKEATSN